MRRTRTICHFLYPVFLAIFIISADAEEPKKKEERTSSFNQSWLDAIISVEYLNEKGEFKPIGTGFLVRSDQDNPVLITNKHVILKIEEKLRKNFIYRRSDIKGEKEYISESDLAAHWGGSWHFSDSHDLACRFIAWPDGSQPFVSLPLESAASKKSIQPGAPLLILGFPLGLRSDYHNRPLVRSGLVSLVDEKKIIIETFVYPGNSGGPVIYAPPIKVGKNLSSPFVNHELLVGVISGYLPYIEEAKSAHTGRTRITFEENSGLTDVIPADEIVRLLERKDVRDDENKLPKKKILSLPETGLNGDLNFQ